MLATEEFGKNIRDFKNMFTNDDFEKIIRDFTFKKCSLAFFIVMSICGSRTFIVCEQFSKVTNKFSIFVTIFLNQ